VELSGILENLLELSRFQSNRLVLNKVPMDVARIINKCAGAYAVAKSGHEIVVDISPGLPVVAVDATRIEAVLNNLIGNASKYSPDGSEIRITARQHNGGILVEVRDQGIGISQADQKRLFQRFERLEDDPSRAKGVGLGLVVCKHLVEAHGGQIWVESIPGEGSNFLFTIPV